MKKGEWTFITNHGRVLAYLAKNKTPTIQEIAHETALSIGAVDNIIKDLRSGGYVSWQKVGRRNHYVVDGNRPMRHRLERDYQIGDVLAAMGCNRNGEISNMVTSQPQKAENSLSVILAGSRRETVHQ